MKDNFSTHTSYEANDFHLGSYTKTNKLIAGLYMVTDIMDKDEPIRLKLRTLGVEILSDINSESTKDLEKKIHEVLSFLDIASIVGIISPMNCGILKKEFFQLQESAKEAIPERGMPSLHDGQATLSEFLKVNEIEGYGTARKNNKSNKSNKQNFNSIGQAKHTRIGLQKGHTLMKALSDRIPGLSNTKESFDVFKKERRDQIISVIKNNPNGTTIKDIRTQAQGALASCSEKTLQRELSAMVKEGVLNKVGEKRWSRYLLVN